MHWYTEYVLSVLRHFLYSAIFTSQYYNESSAIFCMLKYKVIKGYFSLSLI